MSNDNHIILILKFHNIFMIFFHRARVVAANNILNAIFMVTSAIFSIIVLSILNIDMKILFCITAILSAIFSIWLLIRIKPLLKTAQLSLED